MRALRMIFRAEKKRKKKLALEEAEAKAALDRQLRLVEARGEKFSDQKTAEDDGSASAAANKTSATNTSAASIGGPVSSSPSPATSPAGGGAAGRGGRVNRSTRGEVAMDHRPSGGADSPFGSGLETIPVEVSRSDSSLRLEASAMLESSQSALSMFASDLGLQLSQISETHSSRRPKWKPQPGPGGSRRDSSTQSEPVNTAKVQTAAGAKAKQSDGRIDPAHSTFTAVRT